MKNVVEYAGGAWVENPIEGLHMLNNNQKVLVEATNAAFKRIDKLEARTFWLSLCFLVAGYCICKLKDASDMSRAQLFAVQSQLDSDSMEKQVEEG